MIHFATHAIVDDRSLARTALVLAPDSGESGLVGPGTWPRSSSTPIWSCSRPVEPRAVRWPRRRRSGAHLPLIQAGARSVVASQWRIGDRTTIAFVQAFYQALANGLPVGDALRAAKLDAFSRGVLARSGRPYPVGDPLIVVPLRAPRPVLSAIG